MRADCAEVVDELAWKVGASPAVRVAGPVLCLVRHVIQHHGTSHTTVCAAGVQKVHAGFDPVFH